MVIEDGSVRRTSEWPCAAELERAARYVHDIRRGSSATARLRCAASAEGIGAVRALLRSLPTVDLDFSDSPMGREMRAWFRPDRRLPFNRVPIASLDLPATVEDYLRGRPRQALRTNLSRAAAAGLSCAPVTEENELRRIVAHLAAARDMPTEVMVRTELVPRPHRWFTVAYDAAGDPIALNQTVVDGARAGLVLMVHVPGHSAAPLVRYALHTGVARRLISRGVATLTVGGSMLLVSEGTRYFQRRTGFTPVRVQVLATPPESGARPRPVAEPIVTRRIVVPEQRAAVGEPAPVG